MCKLAEPAPSTSKKPFLTEYGWISLLLGVKIFIIETVPRRWEQIWGRHIQMLGSRLAVLLQISHASSLEILRWYISWQCSSQKVLRNWGCRLHFISMKWLEEYCLMVPLNLIHKLIRYTIIYGEKEWKVTFVFFVLCH